MSRKLSILVGSTASGKSDIAIDWARRTGGWILSCDALLFYRGADIGTAKPSRAELDEIPHFGINLCEPSEAYDLSRYVDHALSTLERADREKVPVLVVGGSGFYAAAFNNPPPDPIAVPDSIRERVRQTEKEGGSEGLREALLAVDPEPDVDLLNPRRLAPALERCLTTGLTTAELRRRQQALPCPFERWSRTWFRVERSDEELRARIRRRTESLLSRGLVEEVRSLCNAGIRKNPTLAAAIGYRETLSFLDGEIDHSELADAITLHTEQLAARQKRWIRNRLPETHPISNADELNP